MHIREEDLRHYGTKRHSGRYPWGSGGNETTDSATAFLGLVDQLKKSGLTEKQIAEHFGIKSTTELRAKKTVALSEKRNEDLHTASKLKEKGMSVAAISRQMGIPDSTVRNLLKPAEAQKLTVLESTTEVLRQAVAQHKYLDVGAGTELYMGISKPKLTSAIAVLKEEGYSLYYLKVPQVGTGKETRMKILCPPGVDYKELYQNRGLVRTVAEYSEDGGKTYVKIHYPTSVDSSRLSVRYAEQGGDLADGVIELRRGVPDLSLGNSHYAQVRIMVDGTHYIKGMAVYSDSLPKGTDIRFNTSKSDTGSKLDALKRVEDNIELPLGAVIRRQRGAVNVLNEEGEWDTWSANFSSQMLSKQSPTLIKSQLGVTYDGRKREYDEIMSLTNPVVKKHLLAEYADGLDSAAVHLKAASFPRTRSQVILPVNSLKDTEIYAPNFRDGERVVLIRHPHGGTFEIPVLTVNNKNPQAKKIIGSVARDAVGINAKVAQIISGADFDGDTVLVIPDNAGRIKTSPPLAGLKDFNPRERYPYRPGIKVMSDAFKEQQMGVATNLVTDMTIAGASHDEIARAVRHTMVVIDAAKHKLDYRQSEIDNGIAALRAKYQPGGGASTLISKSRSEIYVDEFKPRSAKAGGPIDRATGKKVYEKTNAGYTDANGVFHPKRVKVATLDVTEDAHTISSGTRVEELYADYSNRTRALANQARKDMLAIGNVPASPVAKKTYAAEVSSLNAKLNASLKNAPLERQAQVLANATIKMRAAEYPNMDNATKKKIARQALADARRITGAAKYDIEITPREWEAIQAGAISNTKLAEILKHTNVDLVKAYATPRAKLMTSAKTARAKAMLAQGYTQAQVADALGVSLTTLKTEL